MSLISKPTPLTPESPVPVAMVLSDYGKENNTSSPFIIII